MMASMSDWATKTEDRVLDAAVSMAPQMGWGRALFERASRRAGLEAAAQRNPGPGATCREAHQ